MLLKKLKLKNIRSYIDEEIMFPEGTTLLSGDIGSGKSTILLAIDFALFGIRRGELSGSALLRNGAYEGNVTLNFVVGEKEIFIKRTLKKTSNGINQDSGYLTLDDVTQELTPVELKQRILQILNYPQDTINKKSLIYRYTVYTPQEEMKLILLGEKEYRLETLRKVFNIDKYKRIGENSKIITTEIKQKKKESIGFVSDLESKKLKVKEIEVELLKTNEQIELNRKRLETTIQLIAIKKQNISNFEQQIISMNELKKDLEVVKHTIKLKEELKSRNVNQLTTLEKQLENIVNNTKEIDFEGLKEKIIENEKNLELLENELRQVLNKAIEIKNKKQNSEEIKIKITKLDFCPLCKQNVSEDHKHGVIQREEETIKKLEIDFEEFTKKELELSNKIKELKENFKALKSQEREYEVSKIKLYDIKNKKESIKTLNNEKEEIEVLIEQITERKEKIEQELSELKDIEANYQTTKKETEELQEQQKKIELNIAVLNKDYQHLSREINNLKSEIETKEKVKAKLDYYTKLQDWLENFFINIVEIMEKKIMLKVHTDFNDLFQKWFSMLMDNELIKVKLNEEFTPLIEQNGHDIEYENLSGGEKTACALAYRLALNQVINTIVSSINTKDLIILDEPTDGFSSEQLDKVRNVLNELSMKQIIVVSHESKIESFVQNIIKIQKQGHISKIYKV